MYYWERQTGERMDAHWDTKRSIDFKKMNYNLTFANSLEPIDFIDY